MRLVEKWMISINQFHRRSGFKIELKRRESWDFDVYLLTARECIERHQFVVLFRWDVPVSWPAENVSLLGFSHWIRIRRGDELAIEYNNNPPIPISDIVPARLRRWWVPDERSREASLLPVRFFVYRGQSGRIRDNVVLSDSSRIAILTCPFSKFVLELDVLRRQRRESFFFGIVPFQ